MSFWCQNPWFQTKRRVNSSTADSSNDKLQKDVTAYNENDIPLTATNKDELRKEIETHITHVNIAILSCSDRDHDQDRQYDGALLATVRIQTGGVEHQGTSEQGIYAWITTRGKQDEGVLVISVYRVCQEEKSMIGPHSLYGSDPCYD